MREALPALPPSPRASPTSVCVAAPHPNPLPASGERGPAHNGLITGGKLQYDERPVDTATRSHPRLKRDPP
jgi:hypothetical protein